MLEWILKVVNHSHGAVQKGRTPNLFHSTCYQTKGKVLKKEEN